MSLRRDLPVVVAVLTSGIALVLAGCGGGGAGTDEFGEKRDTIELVDKTWNCDGPVDVDLVKVTIRSADKDAIRFRDGCTGRVGRIEVVQYWRDGVKVHSGSHDILVSSGTIRCYSRKPTVHQDGVQVMGGERVTFIGIDIDCPTANNSPFFIRRGIKSPQRPTDVVCVRCRLSGGSFTVRINDSIRSGVRDSTICTGRVGAIRVLALATDPINVGNRVQQRC